MALAIAGITMLADRLHAVVQFGRPMIFFAVVAVAGVLAGVLHRGRGITAMSLACIGVLLGFLFVAASAVALRHSRYGTPMAEVVPAVAKWFVQPRLLAAPLLAMVVAVLAARAK